MRSGLFGVAIAREFGGSALGFATLVEVTAELAQACGSTGWVYGVLAGHSWLLNLFPEQAQREVHSDAGALAATVFRLDAEVTLASGGYRLRSGRGRFCSGIDHAQWVIVSSVMRTSDQGAGDSRFFLVPAQEVEIIDDWFTAGMRGTGSRSIRIADSFVPEHRTVAVEDVIQGNSPGARFLQAPWYRTPFQDVAPFSIIGVPLGLAARAVVSFSESLKSRLNGASVDQLAHASATLARIGHAAADVDAAHTLVIADAVAIDRATTPETRSTQERARLGRDWAYAAHQARSCVSSLFEASGGSGIYDTSELQRIWRDVNSAAQHAAFVWDTAMTNFGRSAVGLEPTSWDRARTSGASPGSGS